MYTYPSESTSRQCATKNERARPARENRFLHQTFFLTSHLTKMYICISSPLVDSIGSPTFIFFSCVVVLFNSQYQPIIIFWPLVGPCMCPSISFGQPSPPCTATECSLASQQQLNATKKEYPIGKDENLPLSVDSLRRPVSANELPRTFGFF